MVLGGRVGALTGCVREGEARRHWDATRVKRVQSQSVRNNFLKLSGANNCCCSIPAVPKFFRNYLKKSFLFVF